MSLGLQDEVKPPQRLSQLSRRQPEGCGAQNPDEKSGSTRKD